MPADPQSLVSAAAPGRENEISLLDVLDHVLNSGVVIQGSLVLSIAVIAAFFARVPRAPFRLPTTLPDMATLSAWLTANAPAVARELARLAPMVQMEVHLHPAGTASQAAATGREYLESRRAAQRS